MFDKRQQAGWDVICEDGPTIIPYYVCLSTAQTANEAITIAKSQIDCTTNAVWSVDVISYEDLEDREI